MSKLLRWLPVLLMAALLPACGMGRSAAEKALTEAETAYAGISAEASSVAPDQAAEVETALASARAVFAKGDYGAVMKAAQAIQSRIVELGASLPGQRAKLEADWKVLTEAVPGAITALDRKLKSFGRPPAGMPSRAQFDATTAQLGEVRARWTEAQSLSAASLAKAVAMADQARLDAVKALTEFGQQGS